MVDLDMCEDPPAADLLEKLHDEAVRARAVVMIVSYKLPRFGSRYSIPTVPSSPSDSFL